jgi:hypothetical protein
MSGESEYFPELSWGRQSVCRGSSGTTDGLFSDSSRIKLGKEGFPG